MTTTQVTEPDGSPAPTAPSGGRFRRAKAWLRPLAAVLAVAGLVVAIVFAALFGYRWYDDAVHKQGVQDTREAALGGAEQAMLNVLNIDLKDTGAYRQRLENSLTGSARSQVLGSDGLGALQQAAGADTAATLTARVLRSAVVSLNTDDDTATTLVYLTATSSRPNEASSSQTMGFQVEVTRQDGVWKASTIQSLDAVTLDNTAAATPNTATPDTATPAPSPAPAAPAPAGGS